MPLLSIVIPVHNEEETIDKVVSQLASMLNEKKINHEIIVVNDHSTDKTKEILSALSSKFNKLPPHPAPLPQGERAKGISFKTIDSKLSRGFGGAVKSGMENAGGDYIIIYMGDNSDDPEDVVQYYEKLSEGWDCVFGSRFIKGADVKDYPLIKLIFNRFGNYLIKLLFNISYNDVSNAFKGYRREVIESIKPIVSNHFNITVEIPLKAINRGFSYAVVPINWYGRTSGVSKFSLGKLQKKYLFSILYVWLERILLGDEIKRKKGKIINENTPDKSTGA